MQSTRWMAAGGVLAVCACGSVGPAAVGHHRGSDSPPHPPASVAAPPQSAPPPPSSVAPEPGPSGIGIERIHTGQPLPTLVVVNAYPKSQHVLLDGAVAGVVPPGDSATFDVTLGVHTVTCADGADGQGNPSSITETFEAGFRYRYEIRTR